MAIRVHFSDANVLRATIWISKEVELRMITKHMLSSNLNQHTIATSAALYRPITGSSQNTGQTNSLRVEQLVCRVGLHSPIYNTVRRAVGLLLLRLNIICTYQL